MNLSIILFCIIVPLLLWILIGCLTYAWAITTNSTEPRLKHAFWSALLGPIALLVYKIEMKRFKAQRNKAKLYTRDEIREILHNLAIDMDRQSEPFRYDGSETGTEITHWLENPYQKITDWKHTHYPKL